jgi:hypothetical protein
MVISDVSVTTKMIEMPEGYYVKMPGATVAVVFSDEGEADEFAEALRKRFLPPALPPGSTQ